MESDLTGNPTAQYIFFDGRRIARVDQPSGLVHYFTQDHLGSMRMAFTGTCSTASYCSTPITT
jgi:hypothetical protein